MNDTPTPSLPMSDSSITPAVELTSNDFYSMYNRIRVATNASTQAQLAVVLGIRQSAISDAKRKQHIPAEWLRVLFREHSISPMWIYFGVGPHDLLSTVRDNESFIDCFCPKRGEH